MAVSISEFPTTSTIMPITIIKPIIAVFTLCCRILRQAIVKECAASSLATRFHIMPAVFNDHAIQKANDMVRYINNGGIMGGKK